MRVIYTDPNGVTIFAADNETSGPPGNRYLVCGVQSQDPHDPGIKRDLIARILFQNGAITPEKPPNGVTIEHLLAVCIDRTRVKNIIVPSDANAKAITLMDQALQALEARSADRVARGIVGTTQT